MARESVKARMASEHGISFTEFTYMLLQAHDYLWLHENMEVELQIGGSDQWGKIGSGVDLIRRVRGEDAHGLRRPLLLADRTSPRLNSSRNSAYRLQSSDRDQIT